MREVGENFLWNLYWTDLSVSVERAKEMKRFQKINHFPGMNEICRKDLLARNLNRMLKIFPKDYNFFPMTWCLPSDHGEFANYARPKRNKTYICKPDTGCQGRGIYVTRSYKDIKPYDRMICQVYLQKPFLIDGFKFDLRVYTLITSCDPMRIFVYNEGLARFATSPYKEPTVTNSSNVFMHLTNYAVNKHSRTYKIDEEAGSKRKLSTLNRILLTKGINVTELWSRIDDIIVKTVIAAHPTLKHSYNACFPSHDFTYACFELLGFDVLIDHKLKPYLLEVNHSPSFHTELQIDREIKESLLMDTFEILNLSQTDKKKIIEEDRRRVRERLLQGIIHKESNTTENGEDQNDPFLAQRQWEEKHMGNFRCIYPQENSEDYERFFNQNASSLFQDTAASRAREECSRIQRQEMLTKAANEAAKRSGSRPNLSGSDKLRPESASSRDGKNTKAISVPPKKKPLLPARRIKLPQRDSSLLNSFLPEKFDDDEENERKSELAQRDFLIKSYNLTEQIYLGMMKNGTLRDTDKKKYGSLGRLQFLSNSSPTNPNKLPSIGASNAVGDKLPAHSSTTGIPPPSSYAVTVSELTPTCNNLPISVRPAVPNTVWHNDQPRGTKADEARSFTNSVKLHGLEKREQRQLLNSASATY